MKSIGSLPGIKPRSLAQRLTAPLSAAGRLQAELEEGQGPHRLAERLLAMELGDEVTLVLRPTLAFLSADLCLVGPGRALVLNALHWTGEVALGKKGEWRGAGGRVDLGRPDRRANLLCDRLIYSGNAQGMELEPVVVFTAGPVKYLGDAAEATLVQSDELDGFIRSRIAAGAVGLTAAQLIRAVSPQR